MRACWSMCWDRSARFCDAGIAAGMGVEIHRDWTKESVMNVDRRAVLRVGGYGLAASLVPLRFALAAAEIKTLRLIDPLSKPSMTWTVLDLLRPAVQRNL